MYICYVDDSGTPDIQDIGNTNHFVLAGIAIPVEKWRDWDKEIFDIKKSYKLKDSEIHTAWLMRKYHEQNNIAQFEELDHSKRIESVENHRKNKLKIIQNADRQKYKRTKKNYQKTKDYIHLTYDERKNFLEDISKCVSNWTEARLFAECVDKRYNYPNELGKKRIGEQAFEQVITRFDTFLQIASNTSGIIVHDNNDSEAMNIMKSARDYLQRGTQYQPIQKVIETPLFVDSKLTSMVQVADLCAYALRRYLEKEEKNLFDQIIKRADKKDGKIVGVRHYKNYPCGCLICKSR